MKGLHPELAVDGGNLISPLQQSPSNCRRQTYNTLVKEAVTNAKSRNGTSKKIICDHILATNDIKKDRAEIMAERALKRLCQKGTLMRNKRGFYQIASEMTMKKKKRKKPKSRGRSKSRSKGKSARKPRVRRRGPGRPRGRPRGKRSSLKRKAGRKGARKCGRKVRKSKKRKTVRKASRGGKKKKGSKKPSFRRGKRGRK